MILPNYCTENVLKVHFYSFRRTYFCVMALERLEFPPGHSKSTFKRQVLACGGFDCRVSDGRSTGASLLVTRDACDTFRPSFISEIFSGEREWLARFWSEKGVRLQGLRSRSTRKPRLRPRFRKYSAIFLKKCF